MTRFIEVAFISCFLTAFAFLATHREVLRVLLEVRTRLHRRSEYLGVEFDKAAKDARRIGVPTASMFLFVVSGIHPVISVAAVICWGLLIWVFYVTGFIDERLPPPTPPPVLSKENDDQNGVS